MTPHAGGCAGPLGVRRQPTHGLREVGDRPQLWVVSLDERAAYEALVGVLSPPERRRAGRFQLARLGRRYAVGRGALRMLLGAELGMPADAVPLGVGEHGKPELECATEIEFNVSRCDHIGVIGIARNVAVGVDVERCSRPRDLARIAHHLFDPQESEVIAQLPDHLTEAALLRCWTAKEAVVKAIGIGLTRGLREVVLEPDPRRELHVLRAPDGVTPSTWTLHQVGLCDSRMTVAVAVAAPGVPLASIQPFRRC
jgi:4'-phosphopantetheinyl transferase